MTAFPLVQGFCPACGKPVFPELEEDEDAPVDEDGDDSNE